MPSSSSAMMPETHPASHAASPLAMASVSHVMSHDTLPGPTLRPCSPWIRTASQANTATAAPGSPGGSVVIAANKQQPTLAEALGFPDCAYFSSKPRLSAPASRQATRAAHTSSVPLARQTQRGPAMHQGDPSTLRGTEDRMHLQQAAQSSKSFGHQSSVADVAAASAPEPIFHTDGQTEFDLGHAADGNRKPSQSPKRRRPRRHARGKTVTLGNRQAEGSPKYMLVMRNLNKRQYKQLQRRFRRKGVKVNNWEHLMSWLSPAHRGTHTPCWTFLFTAALLVIFFFMAGSYGMYLASQDGLVSSASTTAAVTQYDSTELQTAAAPSTAAQSPAMSPEPGEVTSTDYSVSANSSFTSEEVQEWAQTGPSSMTKWVSWQPDWRLFDFDFLLAWGGRYGPALHQGQWWRWMSWVFVHEGFQHMVSNVLVWLALALPLEHAYGTPRILAVWLISALGSAFFSAAFEDSCTLVVGCSGAVFGFMGLYVADMALNFRSLSFPWLRLIWIGATLAYFVVASVTQGQGSYVSYWSHLGGFVCGLFPSFFFLPNLKDKRWQAASKLASKLGLLSRRSGKERRQRRCPGVGQGKGKGMTDSIRKVSSRLHRHRHSESLMTSYLRMQAATADPEGGTGRELNRPAVGALADDRSAVGGQDGRQGSKGVHGGGGEGMPGVVHGYSHSVQVSGYSQDSKGKGRSGMVGSRLCRQNQAAGPEENMRGRRQLSSDFKLGYYFRGIDRHDEKMQAKAQAEQSRNKRRPNMTSAAAAASDPADHTTRSKQCRQLVRKARFGKLKSRKQSKVAGRQQRSQCCGVPLHLVVMVCMGIGAVAVLGVFVALPLYLYLDRFPHMEC